MPDLGEGSTQVKDQLTRIELLEANQKRIVDAIDELKTSFVSEMKSIREELSTKARPFPLVAVLSSIASTATIVVTIMVAANFWHDAKSALVREEVASIKTLLKEAPPSELKYRMDELTRRLRLVNPIF